jgi:ABC-2 type transport system permease protein
MAGTLRADVTLAAANLIYVTLLLTGGVIIPLERYPAAIQPLLVLTPAGALAGGLRALLGDGGPIPWAAVGILAVWTVVGFATAARWFRWE